MREYVDDVSNVVYVTAYTFQVYFPCIVEKNRGGTKVGGKSDVEERKKAGGRGEERAKYEA